MQDMRFGDIAIQGQKAHKKIIINKPEVTEFLYKPYEQRQESHRKSSTYAHRKRG